MISQAASSTRHGVSRGVARLLAALLGALVLALGLPSCSPEDPFIPTRPSDTIEFKGAFLRVIHAAPDAPAVGVNIDGIAFFPGPQGYLDFRPANNNARYYPVSDTAKAIAFMNGGSQVASGDLALARDGYYTAYLYGSSETGYRVLVTSDSITVDAQSDKPAKYRIVHLSPDAPSLDIKQDAPTTQPVITGLSYGTASDYITSKAYVNPGTGMWIYKNGTDEVIRAFTPPYILLPGAATFTLVLTGNAAPTGEESFLYFSAFQENSKRVDDPLYGSPPFNITFTAFRFVNLVASGDSLLDVTFYDANSEFRYNDNFRRNLIDQPLAMENVASLGLPGQPEDRRYFYASLLTRDTYPFRVERHQPDNLPSDKNLGTGDYRKQDVLVGRNELKPEVNRRYSIVAYGEYEAGKAKSVVLTDNTPTPPAGMSQLRFFHGAFGYESQKLRIRVDGITGNPMGYGEAPAGTNSFAVTAGPDKTIELLDASGATLTSLKLRELKAGMAYTVYLSRGPRGDQLYMHAVAEDVNIGQ